MPAFTRRQLVVLLLLTLVWGLNWPVLKISVADFPPLTFRALSLALSVPLYVLVLRQQRLPLTIARAHWGQLGWLALWNMVLWNALMILSIPRLASGRAAILGYTMPIFSAVLGQLLFHDRLGLRAWAGVAAAAGGVSLLLANEMGSLGGSATGVALMLAAAACWALGTQLLRRSELAMPLITLTLWMTLLTVGVLAVLAWLLESGSWHWPGAATGFGIVYNAVLALAFAQVAWFYLARTLPPVASTLSVMMIPVIGVFAGSWWLGEALHWQDWSAMALIVLAIASVLRPARAAPRP
ncbi:DMT family transporter [Comamonas flocculans]|uniref:EamA family transporter n=1 Tax=Comamonas flocculans TaxID=2597701 RepID=A0A5B8RT20_9BURK|nr:EamA family transporter [Comamonas flocculans]QEA12799.1 EamA family transporter [Comamonas flocculans]